MVRASGIIFNMWRLNFFSKAAVGLDVADRSIEVAEIVRRGRQLEVTALGRQVLPAGVVERGVIKDEVRLAAAVKSVLELAKPEPITPRRLYFGLPETQVFLHAFVCPAEQQPHTAEEWRARVLREAKENVPIEADDLVVTYKRLSGDNFLLASVSRSFLERWQKFFQSFGWAVEFDLETSALFRSVAPAEASINGSPAGPLAVVDFGAVSTHVAIFERGGLRYSRILNYGAEMLTTDLVKNLKITSSEAEEMKKEIGLTNPDHQVFTVLLKNLVVLRDELKVTLDYYEQWSGRKVDSLFLAGGGSHLRGLSDYLKSNLELPVNLAHSFFLNQPLVYLEAIGLALKEFSSSRWRSGEELNFRLDGQHDRSGSRYGLRVAMTGVFLVLVVSSGWYLFRQNRQILEPSKPAKVESPVETVPSAISPVTISISSELATTSPPVEEVEMVVITVTPTGWLNVRAGPGPTFGVVGKVYPEENYPLLETDGEWYKIEIGWISKQYAIKKLIIP